MKTICAEPCCAVEREEKQNTRAMLESAAEMPNKGMGKRRIQEVCKGVQERRRGEARRKGVRVEARLEPLHLAALPNLSKHYNSINKQSTFIADTLNLQMLTNGINDTGRLTFHARLAREELLDAELEHAVGVGEHFEAEVVGERCLVYVHGSDLRGRAAARESP